MKSNLVLIALTCALSGCAVTADGLRVVSPAPSADKTSQLKSQLQQNADASRPGAAPATNGQPVAEKAKPGLVWIGNTGPLRELKGADIDKFYAGYLKNAQAWHPGVPARIDLETFRAQTAGWTSVEVWSIPGFFNRRKSVIVTRETGERTGFASTAGSFLVGTTGDLVSARSNDDGMAYLERILCKDDANYRECAAHYERGTYDANSGQELDADLKPKSSGSTIDTATYMTLQR